MRYASTRCCRKLSARAAAIRRASRMREAIAGDEADINQCPPGGAAGIRDLAALLGRASKPLNPVHGIEKPAEIALIDEEACIGCTKCILVCPVDAIVGASKMMHTVIARRVQRLRIVHSGLPGRLHRDGRSRRQPTEGEAGKPSGSGSMDGCLRRTRNHARRAIPAPL